MNDDVRAAAERLRAFREGRLSEADYDPRQQGRDESRLADVYLALMPVMIDALKGVIAVADRRTVEFDKAHAALAHAEGRPTPEGRP